MEDSAASLIAATPAGKQLLDLQSVHHSPNMSLVHCAREAAYAAKAAAKLAASTKVDPVKDMANAATGAAEHTEFLARKLACRLGLPVMAGDPFLPTLARSGEVALGALVAAVTRRRVYEFI